MGKSAPGSALRGFPHAVLYHRLTWQGKNGGAHDPHCATLHSGRHHDGRLKSLGKFQRASLGTFKRAPTDLITGRHPTHRPITFTNEAAHLFMSNHLINTRDHSEAFFARWLVIEFPNSRLRTGLPIDPMLAKRISDSEMPGIAYWALEGAARLMKNGAFSKSSAHDRLMNQWRRSANSLEEFIGEECTLSQDSQYRRSDFYRDYTSWCSDNGRKPFAKGRVKDLLEHNIGMGIRLVELNGHETFKGVMKKSAHVEYVSPQINMSSNVSGSNQPTERF